MIEMVLSKANTTHTHIGLCGQAPSDYPAFAKFLVENNISSISFTPDALIKGIQNMVQAEAMMVPAIVHV
jgi:pyruvate,water dikinase